MRADAAKPASFKSPDMAPRTMMTRLLIVLLAGAVFSACSLPRMSLKMPRVHRVTVQQGNVITQEMVDQLKPGMTREQVAFVMGEPVARSSFKSDRWDYVHTLEVPGRYADKKHLTLYFERDGLVRIRGDGDYAPGSKRDSAASAEDSSTDGQESTP